MLLPGQPRQYSRRARAASADEPDGWRRMSWFGRCGLGPPGVGVRVHGDAHDERRALPLTARHPDRAAEVVEDLLHDREPEARPLEPARRRRVGLIEALEDVRLRVLADPETLVADLDRD